MTIEEFWRRPDIAHKYAQLENDPARSWYERGINEPSVIGLIPRDTQRVLDFGCGPGVFTAHLAQRFKTVEGCDISNPMLAVARRDHPKLHFFRWDFREQPPGGTGPYDAIVIKQVTEYINQLDAFADAMRRLLAPHGVLILSLLHPSCTAPFVDNYWQTTEYQTPVSEYGLYPKTIHRSQESIFRPFVERGFLLRNLVEPRPAPEQIKPYETDPTLYKQPLRLNVRFEKDA